MSVPSYNRKESKLAYEENCLEMVRVTLQKSLCFPNRLRGLMLEQLCTTAYEIHALVLEIKSAYPIDLPENKAKRIDLSQKAISKCELMLAIMTALYEYSPRTITPSQWEYWANVINKEISLLNGVYTSTLQKPSKKSEKV